MKTSIIYFIGLLIASAGLADMSGFKSYGFMAFGIGAILFALSQGLFNYLNKR